MHIICFWDKGEKRDDIITIYLVKKDVKKWINVAWNSGAAIRGFYK
jgi:hypothetical protein